MQSITSLSQQDNTSTALAPKKKPAKPRLHMVWVKQMDEKGCERLTAIWTTQD